MSERQRLINAVDGMASVITRWTYVGPLGWGGVAGVECVQILISKEILNLSFKIHV